MNSQAGEESFALNWRGKRAAFREADAPAASRLEWIRDTSAGPNLFIEGENLEALKHLAADHAGRIKLILIDPPYNTRAPLLYADDFARPGDRHSRWLSMMAPRLRLARDLLAPEGAIFVHIDENEQAVLDLLMAEIFGEENRLGTLVWDKRNPKGDARGIAQQHEYILGWARDLATFHRKVDFRRPKENAETMLEKAAELIRDLGLEAARPAYRRWLAAQPFSAGERAYDKIDDAGEVYRAVSMAWPNRKPAPAAYFTPLHHPVTGKECPVPARGWRNPPATMAVLLAEGRILFGPDETVQPTRKYLLRENMKERMASLIYHGGSDDAALAAMGLAFDNPKPVALLKRIIAAVCSGEDIVLDFFAGSGSTGHAVMEFNAETGQNLRWFLVQRREAPGREGGSGGFADLADLCRARLKKAGERLLAHHPAPSAWRGEVGFAEARLVPLQARSRAARSCKASK